MEVLPAFLLNDEQGTAHSFPGSRGSLICFVKEDCPTCNDVMPVLAGMQAAFNGVLDFFVPGQTVQGNRLLSQRHDLDFPLLDDSTLKVSFAFDIDTVPTLILCDAEGRAVARPVRAGQARVHRQREIAARRLQAPLGDDRRPVVQR